MRLIRQTANATFAWPRNYYEHVIRDEESLNRIRQYILDNLRVGRSTGKTPETTAPEPGDPSQ